MASNQNTGAQRTSSKTFSILTGTTDNGWMPVYTKVSVPAADVCGYCDGFGLYDEGQLECDLCEGRGHTLAPGAIAALARAQKGAL
jgi:DnaJ-class molecular chaperone